MHSYLTVAKVYLCTMCGHKKSTIVEDNSVQVQIDYGGEDESKKME